MKMNHPVTCDRILRPKVNFEKPELWCIALAHDQEYLNDQLISPNGHYSVPTLIRSIVLFANTYKSQQIILAQSRKPTDFIPSENDLLWVEQMAETLELLELNLIDHLYITPDKHLSLLNHEPSIFSLILDI